MLPCEQRVEQHADRHEEEHAENVAQRDHVAQRLVGVFRFVDHESGHERPERERESERPGHVGDANRDGDRRQEEELARVPPRHERHHARNELRRDEHDDAEQHDRPDRRDHHAEEPARRIAQFRENDGQGNDRQILQDEDTEHHAARQRAEPPLRLNGLQRNHRARERDKCAEPQRGPRGPPRTRPMPKPNAMVRMICIVPPANATVLTGVSS